jgi:hypothetical protein
METKMNFQEFLTKAEELQEIAKNEGFNALFIIEKDDKESEEIETHAMCNTSEGNHASPVFVLIHQIVNKAKEKSEESNDENQLEMDFASGVISESTGPSDLPV